MKAFLIRAHVRLSDPASPHPRSEHRETTRVASTEGEVELFDGGWLPLDEEVPQTRIITTVICPRITRPSLDISVPRLYDDYHIRLM
ncbi:hypothetical protein KSZ_49950 [Dictyobacter formicarum]|uniref:Uncharacterized protein n=1 Tax=Dictyobacter formicarum TaxID=2778368 RepID=A0ABQ3VMQ1_9CHLR|nr:hypothetical protein KSZ_49950 [Dictyobacter formicarum]